MAADARHSQLFGQACREADVLVTIFSHSIMYKNQWSLLSFQFLSSILVVLLTVGFVIGFFP